MKLPKTQAELLEALKNGGTMHYMPYMGRFRPKAYYFFYLPEGGNKHCTKAAEALIEKGLILRSRKSPFADWEFSVAPTKE